VLIPNDRSLHIYSPQRVGRGDLRAGEQVSMLCM
jgi:hypothetical protein